MPYQEIDELIKKALLHPQNRDEKHAIEAKERIWTNIKSDKRIIPWAMLTAMAACFLLLIVCGILVLKLDQQGDKLDEMTARIHNLEQKRQTAAIKPPLQHTPTSEKKAQPVVLSPTIRTEQKEDDQKQQIKAVNSFSIEVSKPISGTVMPLPDVDFPIPEMNIASLAEPTFKPDKPSLRNPPEEHLTELPSKKTQKFKIRLGSKGHLTDQNQPLALHIKL